MILGVAALFLTGAMLLLGGAALAVGTPAGSRAGVVMAACGGVILTLAVIALLVFLPR